MLDIQIRNGIIYDGTGGAPYRGCVDILGDRIVSVGQGDREAGIVIDAAGKCVCPGFVDAHSHCDLAAVSLWEMEGCLRQGVTSCVAGNCGFSPFPLTKQTNKSVLHYSEGILGSSSWGYEDFCSYRQMLKREKTAVNVISLVGHGSLHIKHLGYARREASRRELLAMCEELEQLLEQGAAGLSFGLIYVPGVYTGEQEVRALAEVLARRDRILAVHLRNEGAGLLQSVEEMLRVAEMTGVRVQLSHHKVMGEAYWGRSVQTLAKVREAKERGIRVSVDVYPYTAACSTAMVLLPPWVLEHGTQEAMEILQQEAAYERIAGDLQDGILGWENLVKSCGYDRLVVVRTGSRDGTVQGKTLRQVAKERGTEPLRSLLELLVREQGEVNVKIMGMCAQDVQRILLDEAAVIGSDGLYAPGATHPRKNGTFGRIIRDFVGEQKLLPMEKAIWKMTGRTAEIFGISHRGVLKTGNFADVLAFHPEKFRDRADYEHPERFAVGMDEVILNGKLAIREGILSKNKYGCV